MSLILRQYFMIRTRSKQKFLKEFLHLLGIKQGLTPYQVTKLFTLLLIQRRLKRSKKLSNSSTNTQSSPVISKASHLSITPAVLGRSPSAEISIMGLPSPLIIGDEIQKEN